MLQLLALSFVVDTGHFRNQISCKKASHLPSRWLRWPRWLSVDKWLQFSFAKKLLQVKKLLEVPNLVSIETVDSLNLAKRIRGRADPSSSVVCEWKSIIAF